MTDYEEYLQSKVYNNVPRILATVDSYIFRMERENIKRYKIDKVFEDLSIFDWWNEYLSKSQLKEMRRFLATALELGYDGYVCFKVGASGCSNGMWAHKEKSTNGYSPDGDFLFRSFTPSYLEWAVMIDGEMNTFKRLNELKRYLADRADGKLVEKERS